VIGQTTFTSQDSNSSNTILGAASGIAYAADTLFVADSNRVGASPTNHRILLYQNLSGQLPRPTDALTYNSKCPVCVGQATLVLGQPDFTTTTLNLTASSNSLRLPTAVASDGVHLVVADTDHNRVLIWNHIPTTNNSPADVVLGQPNFTTTSVPGNTPSAKSMRGPQGVWIQNGRLYVADTQNNRVLIFNHIPTANATAADVVLGAPDFTTFVEPDLTQQTNNVTASVVLNPVSVTSDGVHVFVTDLGYNRVLIWNSIPTTNGAPADVAVGQPDLVSSVANNAYSTSSTDTTVPPVETPVLCTVSNGTDVNSNATYPAYCNQTLSFPRFALAANNRLFIADGGNDRVLVFNTIPTTNGAAADIVLGESLATANSTGTVTQASDAADSLRTPMSLAWDGTNLYVSDAYNRRITVYSMGANTVPYAGVVNSASINIVAKGTITFAATIAPTTVTTPPTPDSVQAGDVIDVNIGGTSSTDSTTNVTTITGGADFDDFAVAQGMFQNGCIGVGRKAAAIAQGVRGVEAFGDHERAFLPVGREDFILRASGFDKRLDDLLVDLLHHARHDAHRFGRRNPASVVALDRLDVFVAQRRVDLRSAPMHQNDAHAVGVEKQNLPRDFGEKQVVLGNRIPADLHDNRALLIRPQLAHHFGDMAEAQGFRHR